MSNQDDQKKKTAANPPISDMILGSLKPRTGKETSKWIAGLTSEAHDAAEEAAKQTEESAKAQQAAAGSKKEPAHDMMHLLDHLFDCFQQYEFEFNRTVSGTDLTITIDRPQIATETIKQRFQPSGTVQVFRGRLSTRQWTLLIRGWEQLIEAWIIPIDKLISFTGDPSSFVRFLSMEAMCYNGDLQWRIDGIELPWDNVRPLAKQLFASLVKVARGEADAAETFSLGPKPSIDRSYENVAAVKPMDSPGYSFESHNPDFDSSFTDSKGPAVSAADLRSQAPGPSGLRGLGKRQQQAGLQTQPVPVPVPAKSGNVAPGFSSGQYQSLPAHDANKVSPQTQAAQIAQPSTPSMPAWQTETPPPSAPPALNQTPLNQSKPGQSTTMPAQQGLTYAAVPTRIPDLSMEQALDLLNLAMASELDLLSKYGAEAFARQDFTAVEKAMKKAGSIKNLQSEIQQQVEHWKGRLREEL